MNAEEIPAVVIISYPGGRMIISQVKYLILGLICSLIYVLTVL